MGKSLWSKQCCILGIIMVKVIQYGGAIVVKVMQDREIIMVKAMQYYYGENCKNNAE